MVFDPPTRSRGRVIGRILWPLLIVAAVVLAIVVSSAGDDTRAEFDYLEEVQTQSVELAKAGDALRDVVSRLQRIERDEFVTVIEGIQEDLNVGLEFVDTEPPSERYVSVQAVFRQTLMAWDRGIAAYQSAVLLAADEPSNVSAVDAMAEALAELRTGDNIYLELVTEITREDLPQPLAPMPAVMLQPAEGPLVSLSVSYVDSARSPNSGLALRPGLGVAQLISDPLWEVNPDDQAVVPASDAIVFSVVITNVGNVTSGEEDLVLTITGGTEPVRIQIALDPLGPGQQVTIVFDPIEVQPGLLYEVVAALGISQNDADFEDNEVRVVFLVNTESG